MDRRWILAADPALAADACAAGRAVTRRRHAQMAAGRQERAQRLADWAPHGSSPAAPGPDHRVAARDGIPCGTRAGVQAVDATAARGSGSCTGCRGLAVDSRRVRRHDRRGVDNEPRSIRVKAGTIPKSLILWRSLRDSNPCYSLERAMSWASRRRERSRADNRSAVL